MDDAIQHLNKYESKNRAGSIGFASWIGIGMLGCAANTSVVRRLAFSPGIDVGRGAGFEMLRTSSIGQIRARGGPSGCSFVKKTVQARGLESPPSSTILQRTDHVRFNSIRVSSSPSIEVTPEVVVEDSAYTTTGKLVRCAVSGTQEHFSVARYHL